MCGWEPWENASTWEIRLHTDAPSQNRLGANSAGWNGRRYRATRRKFERLITAAAKGIPSGKGFRRATITRYYRRGCRPYDAANFTGGCKPLIDVLVGLKLLVDDSPKWFAGYYAQAPSPTLNDHIVIQLEERLVVANDSSAE